MFLSIYSCSFLRLKAHKQRPIFDQRNHLATLRSSNRIENASIYFTIVLLCRSLNQIPTSFWFLLSHLRATLWPALSVCLLVGRLVTLSILLPFYVILNHSTQGHFVLSSFHLFVPHLIIFFGPKRSQTSNLPSQTWNALSMVSIQSSQTSIHPCQAPYHHFQASN